MVDIRPSQLNPAIIPLREDDIIIVDQGARGVNQASVFETVNSVSPVATQSESVAGTDNTKRMTSLRTKQSIASEIGVSLASLSQGVKADTAVQSVNGKTGNSINLVKGDVGLGNVSNLAPADMPVSTATQEALDLKANDSVVVKSVNGVLPVSGNVTVAAEEKRLQDTRTTAIAESFANNVQFVETAGYSSVGDGGGALYKRVSTEPSHAGKFQSADGAWWEIVKYSSESDVRIISQVVAPLDIKINWDSSNPPDITSLINKTLDDYGVCTIPPGIYSISSRIDLRSRTIRGTHNHLTTLQGTGSIGEYDPMIRMGRASYLSDIRLEYRQEVTLSTSAGSRCLVDTTGNPGSYPMQRPSSLERVIFGRCGTGLTDRGVSSFSVGFANLEFKDYFRSAVEFWGTWDTGNVWSNIYIGGSPFNPLYGISMTGHRAGDVFHQLNIEHTNFSVAAANFERQQNLYISAIHIEGVDLSANYQGFINIKNSVVQIDTVNFYFTRRSTEGQACFLLGDSGGYDSAPTDSVGYGQGYLKIGSLSCFGLGVPDATLYPGQQVGFGANQYFFYRPSTATGEVLVDVGIFDYRSFSTNSSVNQRYREMASDPHNKMRWIKKRSIPSSAPTASLPTNRIVNGQTILDSTTGKLKVWNGSAWWDV